MGWREGALLRDQFSTGKLVLSRSLVVVFSNKLSWSQTKKIVRRLQSEVAERLDMFLTTLLGDDRKQSHPCAFIRGDQRNEHLSEPRHAKLMGR